MVIPLPEVTATLLFTLLLSSVLYKLLSSREILDVPNDRSSHDVPTPKGGGLGLVLAICLVVSAKAVQTNYYLYLPLLALCVGTLILSAVGLIDDLRSLKASTRFIVQALLSLALVWFTFQYSRTTRVYPAHVALLMPLATIFLIWSTNLYNFMDGIDGLASLQGILAGLLIFVLSMFGAYHGDLGTLGLVIAMGCLGFLFYNFPPARMFMGDTGSAPLGFLMAGAAIIEYTVDSRSFWLWIIALGGFVADSTATLIVRLHRRQKIFQAHRNHLYQHWTQDIQGKLIQQGIDLPTARTRAHRQYLMIFALTFLVWQTPFAILVGTETISGFAGAAFCLIPMLTVATLLGAGGEHLRICQS